jgi:hypothetical protein
MNIFSILEKIVICINAYWGHSKLIYRIKSYTL